LSISANTICTTIKKSEDLKMKLMNEALGQLVQPHVPKLRVMGLMALLLAVVSGCYTSGASRYYDSVSDGSAPWWCEGTPDLVKSDCLVFSISMDMSLEFAEERWTYQDGLNAGGAALANPRVQAFSISSTPFDPYTPNLIEYESTASDARAIGVGWRKFSSGGAPEGFAGSRDTWVNTGSDIYELRLWSLRGYENHPDVFAAAHPCQSDLPLTSTAQTCYQDSHTKPLEILVVNDDGYAAEGIDALVEALTDDPNDPADTFVAGINVTVVAPLTQQSGSGGATTPGGAPAATPDLTTHSLYPVLAAVHGTPADSVIWALDNESLAPDLVISGINEGQNYGQVGHQFSGTVGAARQAAQWGVDSMATSQELAGGGTDFPAGAAATLQLLELWRIGADGIVLMDVPSVNIPTCLAGSVRNTADGTGILQTIVNFDNDPWVTSDCLSTVVEGAVTDDMDGVSAGFTTVADMGKQQPPNYP
jgi:5'/3'-nucleotidase